MKTRLKKEWKKYAPEIMRVVRLVLLAFLTIDYPMAGKCLVLAIITEVLVGKGRYDRGLGTFLNIVYINVSWIPIKGYAIFNLTMGVCMVVYFIQIFIILGSLALKKVDFLRENEKITGNIVIKIRYIVLAVVLIFTAEFGLAVWPYRNTAKVSDDHKVYFDIEKFYSDKESCDRATIIDDNGEALRHRISLIENAKKEIIISSFIFKADTSGKQVLASLVEAAKRGVKVRILFDGFNAISNIEGNPYFMALAVQDNVEFRQYSEVSPLAPWKVVSRMHDKYIVADDEVFILGDRNITDVFLGVHEEEKTENRDVLVYNTGGEESAVYELRSYFEDMWQNSECEEWDAYIYSGILASIHIAESELEDIYAKMKKEHPNWLEKINYADITVPTDKVTLLSNPTNICAKEPYILYGIGVLMENAKDKIEIHTPYMVIDEYMYNILSGASNNAKVTLMVNSPSKGDNMIGVVDYILHKGRIMGTGVELREYSGKNAYDGKSILIDDDISIIGSYTWDYNSTYHNTELMLVIDSKELNAKLDASHFAYEKDSYQAQIVEDELDKVLNGKDTSKMLQGVFIELFDKYFRFLF